MKITFKLFAGLSEHLPAGARRNATEVELDEGATPETLIERFNVPSSMAHLVLVNGNYVAPEERPGVALRDGDTVAIWPPVAGG